MSLTISDIVFDEGGLTDLDNDSDNNVASLSFLTAGQASVIAALPKASFPDFFPQYAQLDNFVSSDQQVNNYSLTTDGTHLFTTTSRIATGIYVGTDEVFLYGTSDPSIVVGRIGNGTSYNDSGNVAFVIALDQAKTGGMVTDASLSIAVYAPLVHGVTGAVPDSIDDADTLDLTGLVQLRSDFTTSTELDFDSFAGVPSGSDAFAMILPDGADKSVQLIATGFTGGTEGKIWISQDANAGSIGGGGSSGQHVAPGNSVRIDTVNGGDFSKADTSSEDNNTANISYQHHQGIFQASFELVQVNPGTAGQTTSLDISAYNATSDAQGSNFVTDAIASEGTAVTINASNVHIFNGTTDITSTFGGTITQNGASVMITGLQEGYTVKFSTPGVTFDRFVVTNDQPTKGSGSNVTFDIGHIHVSTVTSGSGTEYSDLGQHTVFEDAGPTISASGTPPTVTVDETNLNTPSDATSFAGVFTSSYGADGAGSIDYALGIKSTGANSGLKDTATGHGIFLYMDGNDVVGRVGSSTTTADPSGAIAFRISVDSTTGDVTLDQLSAIVHGDPNAVDESAAMTDASLVTLTATIQDSDGDTAPATANIGTSFSFLDDEPAALAPSPGNSLTVGNTTGADGSQPFNSHDSSSFTTFDPGNDGFGSFTFVGPQDTSGDFRWTWNADHTVITETYKGANLFSITLASDGSYTMQMLGTLPNTQLNLDANKIHAGGPTSHFLDVGVVGTSTDDVLITGNPGPINASNGNVGVSNGNIDAGETLKFQLYTDMSHSTLIPFLGINIGTKSAQAATYHVTGVLDSDHTTVVDLGNYAVGKNGTIHVVNNALLDSVTVTDVSGNAIKVGIAGISLLLPPADTSFTYQVQLKDGDGDPATGSFTVNIDGNNDGSIDNPVSPAAVLSGAAAPLAAASMADMTLSSPAAHIGALSDGGGRMAWAHESSAMMSELLQHEQLFMGDHLIALN